MNLGVAVPAIGCLVFAVAVGWRPLRVHPALSARLLVTAAAVAAGAVASTVIVTTAAFALEGTAHEESHPHLLASLTGHRPVNPAVGIACAAATALLLAAAARAIVRIVTERRHVRAHLDELNAASERIALAVPGRTGGVVLSRGLRSALSRRELQVVIAHEGAHLTHRHHRYLAVSSVCAAAVPFLRRLDQNLRFSIERWADEDVASSVDDRRFVARTIARVALPAPAPTAVPALSDVGVAARVAALLDDTPPRSRLAGAAMITNATIAGSGMTSSIVQLHHLGLL